MAIVRAALYMRVSSIIQAKEGDSIPAQKAALEKYAKDKGYVIYDEYIDDGISGTKADRDEYQRLLADIQSDIIDLVLITKLDRIHRGLRNFLNMQEIMDKHNCKWLAIWEPMYDSSTPQGELIINTMVNFAQFEAKNTGQRIRQVQAYKITKGEVLTGKSPVGYSIKDKHLVPNDQAEYVRELFRFYAMTSNLHETLRHFAHLGIFPKTIFGLKELLRNERYIGKHRGNDSYCPAIIDEDLFEDVQRKMAKNIRSSQKHFYIFSGLVVCAECGKKMTGQLQWSHKGCQPHKAYVCKSHYAQVPPACSNSKKLRQSVLERYLLENIKPLLEMKVDAVRKEKETDNSARIAYLEKKIKKLKELYINDLITIEEYKADKESALAEISTLQTHRAVDTKPYEDFIKLNIGEQYKTFTDAEKQIFWRALIDKIVFDKDRNITVYFLESYRSSK